MWRRYTHALSAAPLRTKAVTSGLITGLSDTLLQLYEKGANAATVTRLQEKHGSDVQVNLQNGCAVNVGYQPPAGTNAQLTFDARQTATLASVGLLYSGPINHFWYAMLEKLVSVKGPPGVVAKLAIDQIVFTPIAISGYFVVRGLLEGSSLDPDIKFKLQRKLVDATLAGSLGCPGGCQCAAAWMARRPLSAATPFRRSMAHAHAAACLPRACRVPAACLPRAMRLSQRTNSGRLSTSSRSRSSLWNFASSSVPSWRSAGTCASR